jgi:hypothetical protein
VETRGVVQTMKTPIKDVGFRSKGWREGGRSILQFSAHRPYCSQLFFNDPLPLIPSCVALPHKVPARRRPQHGRGHPPAPLRGAAAGRCSATRLSCHDGGAMRLWPGGLALRAAAMIGLPWRVHRRGDDAMNGLAAVRRMSCGTS